MQGLNKSRRRGVVGGAVLAASRLAPLSLSGLGLGLAAQAAPIDEGIDFRVLAKAVPTAPSGKIEVLEFFWLRLPALLCH